MKLELTRDQIRNIVVQDLEAYLAFCEDPVTSQALKTILIEYKRTQPDNNNNEVIEKNLDGC